MKKVIVLGSNGQLGKTIKDYADSETISFYFYSHSEVDITDKNSLIKAFNTKNFNYCINCAAYTNVEGAESNTEEAFLINAKGAKNIAEICAVQNVKLIHISTDYVFNGEKRSPYTTEEITDPLNQYGKSKLQGELYIRKQLKEYYIIRTSWLYALHGKNFLKTIISKIDDDAILNITSEEVGTPTSCIDLADFIQHIIKTDGIPSGIYNFSATGSTSWFAFAQEIVRNYNLEKTKNIKPTAQFKTVANRPKYSVLDLSKTERIYKELNTWQKSVAAMVKMYIEKHN